MQSIVTAVATAARTANYIATTPLSALVSPTEGYCSYVWRMRAATVELQLRKSITTATTRTASLSSLYVLPNSCTGLRPCARPVSSPAPAPASDAALGGPRRRD
ncbi:unnamed protein product [Schistocephalus solidus]|uniref:Secreted protein n=1 Tax=Schistocephalus solidus TaxID=70667 RepID=A0A183SGG9_SCHSO|nr:unnamed protein product [Schistocephalus solidus]